MKRREELAFVFIMLVITACETPTFAAQEFAGGVFLSGLDVLGGLQQWWLQANVQSMDAQSAPRRRNMSGRKHG